MPRYRSIKSLKKQAVTLWSLVVKLEHADRNGFCTCVTCGKVKHYKDGIEAGHFVPGRGNAILFEEANCHPQCGPCNRRAGPRVSQVAGAYHAYMLERYGPDVIADLYAKARHARKLYRGELEALITEYKNRIDRQKEKM